MLSSTWCRYGLAARRHNGHTSAGMPAGRMLPHTRSYTTSPHRHSLLVMPASRDRVQLYTSHMCANKVYICHICTRVSDSINGKLVVTQSGRCMSSHDGCTSSPELLYHWMATSSCVIPHVTVGVESRIYADASLFFNEAVYLTKSNNKLQCNTFQSNTMCTTHDILSTVV